MSKPQKIILPSDLFVLDGGQALIAGELGLRRAVPVAPISEDDLLELAARARWPEPVPIARALATAARQRCLTSSDKTHPKSSKRNDPGNGWNLVSRQGISGRLSGFELLIGTRRFIEEAGVGIAESARQVLNEHDAKGWASVLVAARRGNTGSDSTHRSLIGILAFDAEAEATPLVTQQASPTTNRATIAKKIDMQTRHATLYWRRISSLITRARLRSWQFALVLICVSGLAGTLLSLMSVAPDEAVIVQRFGRTVIVCGPGLQVRPLWPFEKITRLHPYQLRTVQIGSPAWSNAHSNLTVHPPISEFVLTGDLYRSDKAQTEAISNPASHNQSKSASQLLRIDARVQYIISNPKAFAFTSSDPDALVAVSAESVLRKLISSQSMMDTLGPQRNMLTMRGQKLLQERLDALGIGIAVRAILLDDLQPAEGTAELNVAEAFRQVARVEAETDEMIWQARLECDRWMNDAQAQANQAITQAKAEHVRDLETARTRLEWINKHLAAFRESPQQLRRQMLVDLIAETNSGWRTIILDPMLDDAVHLPLKIGESTLPEGGEQ